MKKRKLDEVNEELNGLRHTVLYIYIIMCTVCMAPNKSSAQTRTGYFIDSYALSHEINPALQPDSGYMSLPLLGSTNIGVQSTIALSDILFENADGSLTTFMSKGTISKAKLMEKVGNGAKTNADFKLTLLSMGKRITPDKYLTASMSIKSKAQTWLPKGLFDCMKEVENRNYNIGDVRGRATAYVELAAGMSMRKNEHLTIGAKTKLLVGLMNADVKVNGLCLNTSGDTEWMASGKAEVNVAGLNYTTEEKTYSKRPGTYQQVDGVKWDGLKPSGIGLAIDLGATYKLNNRWTFSAAITDLGLIAWTGNHKAQNAEDSFTFGGFHDVEVEKGDENSLKNQWNAISDDLKDLAHLEESGNNSHTQMLGVTFTAAAEYDLKDKVGMTLGTILTHRLDGKFSWTEMRINGTYIPKHLPLSVALSPAISTFGVSLGMMATVSPSKNTTIFIGSDYLFFKVNPQMIPTSLNGNVSLGMTISL